MEESVDDSKDLLGPNEAINDRVDQEPLEKSPETLGYNARKPKWWLRLSSGQRGTKAQRRLVAEMEHYAIQAQYGEFIDWNLLFSNLPRDRDIWVEVGFGQGENLLANAQLYPNKAMVGAEIHKPGTAHVLKRIKEAQESGRYWDGYTLYKGDNNLTGGQDEVPSSLPPGTNTREPYSNIRVYPGNGMKLLNHIPTSSVSAVLLTFPDPFPQDDHTEYRLLQVTNVVDIHRVLRKTNGRLYLATDHEGFYEWCKSVMSHDPTLFAHMIPVPDRTTWLPVISKYEKKGNEEGRSTRLACWQVVNNDCNDKGDIAGE